MSAVKYDEDKLATPYGLFNSGAVLYVPDNVEIDRPIEGILSRTAKAMFAQQAYFGKYS